MKKKQQQKPRPRCHNCKHAGCAFKVNNVTHVHCQLPERVQACTSPWDTLQEFWATCENHEHRKAMADQWL